MAGDDVKLPFAQQGLAALPHGTCLLYTSYNEEAPQAFLNEKGIQPAPSILAGKIPGCYKVKQVPEMK